ncbi:DUF6892 domain-containing protein [Baileyella intestinalis]|uniref:DUF6892 domain-containing protein n=1 Tax=Baileyella intestinalis TaxID=2606709 RepID=UPI0022E6667E|nr:hypothetical protein [Baileyella intestinalis]
MTKEERVKKWFSHIPDAELISLDRKMEICSRISKKMIVIIFGLLALELISLFMLGGGKFLTHTADFLNNISEGSHTKNHYRWLAITGAIVCLPVFIIPLTVASIYKTSCLKYEAAKIVAGMKSSDAKQSNVTTPGEKNREDMLHFDNLNFKLAIVQVLMYDLKLLKPEFDIYDFADQYKGEEIDTDSYTIVEPAMNFFRKLEIPKKLAPYVETIYMDGGNDVYMNIIPQWDGEDESFDLNEITLEELKQFPNLKEATLLSSNFDEVKEIFDAAGVEAELL